MLTTAIKSDGLDFGERCGISFHRTLRVPDDGQAYPLPPGLGRFPLYQVDLQGLGKVVAIPMYRREALWIGLSGTPWKPNAVKILVGGINAVSGLPDDGSELSSPQDYLICPQQPWLDGIDVGNGMIRQFVAMPLGQGYGVEAAYPELREKGGLRIVVFEPKPGHFPDEPPAPPEGPLRFNMPRITEPGPPTLAIGAGGTIRQKIYPDPHGIDVWDQKTFDAVDILLLEATAFTALTGLLPPPTPIDIGTYEANGLPWFELYDEPMGSIEPSERRKLTTIAGRERSEDDTTLIDPATAPSKPDIRKIRWGTAKTARSHEQEPVDAEPASRDRHRSPPHPMEKRHMTDAPKICFDRLLPDDLSAMDPILEGIAPIGKAWPNGSTLRVLFMEGTADQRGLAMAQANWWTGHANLQFVESDDLDSEIRVTFDSSNGAWSYLGTDNRRIPVNQPTMNLGFQDGGTSAHEFGHAISLSHEHQNPDGGIQWNEAEVIRDLSGPPNRWTPDQIQHNVLRKYSSDQIHGTVFDPQSIMLYAFPARWTRNGVATNANEVLSETDKSFAARLYPGRPDAGGSTTLDVNATATKADIGEPGEEDLFSFNADEAGRYVIETSGRTDVIMKLYGPDDRTRLIAEDDDGGLGLNSRIVRRLPRGHYLVQIRHYNRNRGTGHYNISVKNN